MSGDTATVVNEFNDENQRTTLEQWVEEYHRMQGVVTRAEVESILSEIES